MHPMTEQRERYDRIAEGYAAWWEPVHRPGTHGVVELLADDVRAGAQTALDVGTGTGSLVLALHERYPALSITGIDASDGMLELAERRRVDLPAGHRAAIQFRQAYADALPFPDGSFDLVVSAFVYQLVPSRFRALREARRVLRPGGLLAYVTWLRGGAPFAPDAIIDDALDAVGFEPREPDSHPGDVESARAAVAQLRRAGFVDAVARETRLIHAFTPEGYLGFVSKFDEEDLFSSLPPDERRDLEADILARLRALPPDELGLELPIVYATGRRRPGR